MICCPPMRRGMASTCFGLEAVTRHRCLRRRSMSAMPTRRCVTLSDIGLTAKQGRTAVTIWATSLRTAEPLAGVRVRLFSNKNQRLGQATTGADGLATIPIAPRAEGEEPSVILADRPNAAFAKSHRDCVASSGRDLTWLDLRSGKINFGETDTSGDAYLRNGHEAFIYTDRGVYRPGETIHLRAIVRGPDGVTPPSFPVRWQFRRPDLHDWKSIIGQLDPTARSSLDLPLPDDLPTGRWSVSLGLPGGARKANRSARRLPVEDFMPNRMQVGLTLKGDAAADGKDPERFSSTDDAALGRGAGGLSIWQAGRGPPARLVAPNRSDAVSPRNGMRLDVWRFGHGRPDARQPENHRASRGAARADAGCQRTRCFRS